MPVAHRTTPPMAPVESALPEFRHRLMGMRVIRFCVERERDRVGGIGALGLPGASSGLASLAVG